MSKAPPARAAEPEPVVGALIGSTIGKTVDGQRLILLFGMMIVSAQFARAGFYDWVAGKLAAAPGAPKHLLMLVVVVAATSATTFVEALAGRGHRASTSPVGPAR